MKFLSFLLLGVCFNQTPNLDDAIVTFEISHLGALKVEGQFSDIEGKFERKDKGWIITGRIDVKSVDTDNSMRDRTILTEQYLNAEENPSIPFVAEIEISEGILIMSVEAHIRGLPLIFETPLMKVDDELISEPVVIDRESVGLDFGLMDSMIGNEITLVIHSGIKRRLH
ncbi:YceI family protein [Ekhidna sp.]